MLDIHEFGELLRSRGFTFFSGVPCSLLKNLINYTINNFQYIIATNEGEAVAISGGAHLAGKRSCVLMQNSGLTNALNPLTSLNYCFRIPVLGFVSWRGEPGTKDEPEHTLMGEILPSVLDICRIPYATLSLNIKEAKYQLDRAEKHYERDEPFFFIVKRDTFSEEPLKKKLIFEQYRRDIVEANSATFFPTRLEVLEEINKHIDGNTVLLASTGKGGRELFEIEDAPNNLYMVGSMGCVSSIGLGLALNRPEKRIITIDGDGALLMRMGSLATNGYYKPRNLLHILLDNSIHDSTGGQETVSQNIGFPHIASQAGYDRSICTNSPERVGDIIEEWKKEPVLSFLHVKIKKGSKQNLGRPTVAPFQVKRRIMTFIAGSAND
jgi:phosphonopyruvate decarboxylase